MFNEANSFDQWLYWDVNSATDKNHMFNGSNGRLIRFR